MIARADDPAIVSVRLLPRLKYVLLVYVLRAIVTVLVAYPLCAIATKTFGAWPGGDLLLFEPGGLMAAEVIRLHRVAIEAWLGQSALVLVAMIPVGIVLNAILMTALADDDVGESSRVLQRTLAALRPLALAWVVFTAATAAAAGLFYALSEGARAMALRTMSVQASDVARIVVLMLGVIAILVLGIALDATRAAIVRGSLDVTSGIVAAWRAARRSWAGLVAGWWARAAIGVLLVLLEIAFMRWQRGALHVSGGPAIEFGLHQAVVVCLLLLRTSWLARAIELTACEADQERLAIDAVGGSLGGAEVTLEGCDTAARTDAQDDPS